MADASMISDDLAARREVAERMTEAARTWLDTLDAEQRKIGQGSVPADDPSDNERRRWLYTPTDHGGLTIHQQRAAQHRAALRLVSTGLSQQDATDLALLLSGIELASVKRRRRYSFDAATQESEAARSRND